MAEFTVEQISEDNLVQEFLSISNNIVSGNNIYYINDSVLFHFNARTREITQLTSNNETAQDVRFAYDGNEEIVVVSLEIGVKLARLSPGAI